MTRASNWHTTVDIICEWASWSGNRIVLERYLLTELTLEMSEKAMHALKIQVPDNSLQQLNKMQLVQLNKIQSQLDYITTSNKENKSSAQIQSRFQIVSSANLGPSVANQEIVARITHEQSQIPQITQVQRNQLPVSYRYPDLKTVRLVVDFWLHGITSENVPPLKEWPVEQRNKKLRGKYKHRRDIGTVYDYYFDNGRESEFWTKYSCTVTKAREMEVAEIKTIQ